MSNQNNLSKREETLLKSLVESFICDGQPVGSSKLSKIKSVNLSSATIRNVFTDLEEMGLIYSPHTSAGRIPTTKGFRLFIDTMVNFQPVNESILSKIKINNVKDVNQEELLKNTNEMLSNITQLAGVVYLPSKENLHIRQIDFVRVNAVLSSRPLSPFNPKTVAVRFGLTFAPKHSLGLMPKQYFMRKHQAHSGILMLNLSIISNSLWSSILGFFLALYLFAWSESRSSLNPPTS